MNWYKTLKAQFDSQISLDQDSQSDTDPANTLDTRMPLQPAGPRFPDPNEIATMINQHPKPDFRISPKPKSKGLRGKGKGNLWKKLPHEGLQSSPDDPLNSLFTDMQGAPNPVI